MNRRRFVVMTTGGAALVGVGAAGGLWLFCPGPAAPAPAGARLDDIARSMSGVASAGRAWIAAHPDRKPREALLESVDLGPRSRIESAAIVERIAERVERDFEESALFEHDGWRLSETETLLAALHVALLGPAASEAQEASFDSAPEAELVRLDRYNPTEVVQGEPLTHPGLPDNVIWFATAEPPPPRFRLYVEGTSIPVNPSENGFSARLSDPLRQRLYEAPGEHALWLYDPVVDRRQRLGNLTVVAAAAGSEAAFCEVDNWGPQQTRTGQAFNEQPDGASAFWIRVGCFPPDTAVTLNGVELKTTLRPGDGLITTHITDHSLYREPGEYVVALLDKASGTTLPFGTFRVAPQQ